VLTVEQARKLPEQLAGLPVTVVSQALQLSMRVQQRVTELAIKGDDALATLRPTEETPEWATFDEDEPGTEEYSQGDTADTGEPTDPWLQEEQAFAERTPSPEDGSGVAVLPEYDELTIPQLRARLRRFTVDELEELLTYERSHAGRPAYVGMLTRRISTVRANG